MSDLEKAYYDAEFKARHPDFVPEAPAAPAPAADAKPKGRGPDVGGGPAEPAMALMDTMAGLLKGSVAATLGLPGDVESLVRLLSGGKQVMPTTEDVQTMLPDVVPPGGSADRQHNADVGAKIGEFVPLAPAAILKNAVKKVGKKAAKKGAAAAAGVAAPATAGERKPPADGAGDQYLINSTARG